MPPHTWKGRERQVCSDFGTTRNPLSGGNGKHTRSDSLHDELFIEHKHRKASATIALYDDTKELAGKEGKVTVVTLSQHGRRGYLIVIDPKDLSKVAELYQGESR